MAKLAIIIPAYNEEKRIRDTLKAYSEFFDKASKKSNIDYEILVVINNSTDKTLEIVRSFSHKNSNIDYLNLPRGGKGYAVTEGFKEFLSRKNNYIGFVDADMSTTPEEFCRLFSHIGNNDGIIGSRYLSGAEIDPKPTIQRIIASRIFNFSIRSLLFLPYNDTQCGAKIFRRDLLEEVVPHLVFSKWAFDVDLLYQARKRGFKIKEHPTVWASKDYSKINFMKAGPWMFLGVVRIRILNSPLKDLIRLYDKLLYKIWTLK